MYILIIEDHTQVRRLFHEILENQGYHVHSVETVAQAYSLMTSNGYYDLIITDISLPDSDVFETLQRAREILPDAKVLVVSGYMNGEFSWALRRAGAHETLTKPCRPAALLAEVHKLLADRVQVRKAG